MFLVLISGLCIFETLTFSNSKLSIPDSIDAQIKFHSSWHFFWVAENFFVAAFFGCFLLLFRQFSCSFLSVVIPLKFEMNEQGKGQTIVLWYVISFSEMDMFMLLQTYWIFMILLLILDLVLIFFSLVGEKHKHLCVWTNRKDVFFNAFSKEIAYKCMRNLWVF